MTNFGFFIYAADSVANDHLVLNLTIRGQAGPPEKKFSRGEGGVRRSRRSGVCQRGGGGGLRFH